MKYMKNMKKIFKFKEIKYEKNKSKNGYIKNIIAIF